MIHHTFSMLSGIGPKLEQKLWGMGVLTWQDFLDIDGMGFISGRRKALYDDALRIASERLAERNAAYFGEALKSREHWRLFEEFKGQVVCLDIETSGLSVDEGGYVTMVGLYDGREYTAMVQGEGFGADALTEKLSQYKLLVTFFGSAFDVPFLEKSLPGFQCSLPHFDLCFGFRHLGHKGGLKSIETRFGIERDADLMGMDGYDAVILWKRAQRGDSSAMDKLVRYNREDTINLMSLAATAYAGLRTATGIEEHLSNAVA